MSAYTPCSGTRNGRRGDRGGAPRRRREAGGQGCPRRSGLGGAREPAIFNTEEKWKKLHKACDFVPRALYRAKQMNEIQISPSCFAYARTHSDYYPGPLSDSECQRPQSYTEAFSLSFCVVVINFYLDERDGRKSRGGEEPAA